MCDDIKAEVASLAGRNIECGPITDKGWGLLTAIRLPGGSSLGLYQPRHAHSPLKRWSLSPRQSLSWRPRRRGAFR